MDFDMQKTMQHRNSYNFNNERDYILQMGKLQKNVNSNTTRHHPIFGNKKNKSVANLITNKYKNQKRSHHPIFDNKYCWMEFIDIGCCNCQNRIIPCQIIQDTFLQNISLPEMKNSYNQQFSLQETTKPISQSSSYSKQLFKYLPSQYPEMNCPHLNILIKRLGLTAGNFAEFQCLMAIQYHSKYEYLTYFLYHDLKKSYNNIVKFKQQLQLEMEFGSYQIQRYSSTSNNYNQKIFITNYYNSVGANLIPIPVYAKFISKLFITGASLLIRLLVNFMINKNTQFMKGIKLLAKGELQQYMNYMRYINFEQLIDTQK